MTHQPDTRIEHEEQRGPEGLTVEEEETLRLFCERNSSGIPFVTFESGARLIRRLLATLDAARLPVSGESEGLRDIENELFAYWRDEDTHYEYEDGPEREPILFVRWDVMWKRVAAQLGAARATIEEEARTVNPAIPAEDGLRELRELSEAATPGPWIVADDSVDEHGAEVAIIEAGLSVVRPHDDSPIEPADPAADAAFISAAANYLRAALASTERAAGEPGVRRKITVRPDGVIDEEHEFTAEAWSRLSGAARSSGELDAPVICAECGHPETHHGPVGSSAQGCWNAGCETKVGRRTSTACHRGRPFDESVAHLREPRQTEGGTEE